VGPYAKRTGERPSRHEGCICSYKRKQQHSFQPEVNPAPTHGPLPILHSHGADSAKRRGTALVRASSTPLQQRHMSPAPIPSAANIGGASALLTVSSANALADAAGNGGGGGGGGGAGGPRPSLMGLTESAANKRKSRSPLPGRRATQPLAFDSVSRLVSCP
jgi:hypothetical protein